MKKLLSLFLLVLIPFLFGCEDTSLTPSIALNGESTITLTVGEAYIEQGAYASNVEDRVNIVISGDTVDIFTEGTYIVEYSFTYEDTVYRVSRTVTVVAGTTNVEENATFETTISVSSYTSTEISGSVTINDPDEQINYMVLKLYNDSTLVDSITLSSSQEGFSFTNLLSNTMYSLVLEGEYYNGVMDLIYSGEPVNVTTLMDTTSVTATITLADSWAIQSDSFEGYFNIYQDPLIQSITYNISLYDSLGSLVETESTASFYRIYFENLEDGELYSVEVSIDFTVEGDSESYHQVIYTASITTLSSVPSSISFSDEVWTITEEDVSFAFTLVTNENFVSSRIVLEDHSGVELVEQSLTAGTYSIVYDSYIHPNHQYKVIVYGSYFDDSYNLINNEVILEKDITTPVTFEISSAGLHEPTDVSMNAVIDIDLNNPESLSVSKIEMNNQVYTDFTMSMDGQSLSIDLGSLASDHYNYGVVTVYYDTVEGEQSISTLDALIFDVTLPSEATLSLSKVSVDQNLVLLNDISDPFTVTLSVIMDNDYALDISSITVSGVSYSSSAFTVISSTQIDLAISLSSITGHTLTVEQISYLKSGNQESINPTKDHTLEVWGALASTVTHISTPYEFANIGQYGVYVLDNDIDMTGYAMANLYDGSTPWGGRLYGNGYTVSNLQSSPFEQATSSSLLSSSATAAGGLFFTMSGGYIGNITFDHFLSYMIGYDYNYSAYLGGLVGYAEYSTFENVTLTNHVLHVSHPGINSYFGGVVGYAINTDFIDVRMVDSVVNIDAPASETGTTNVYYAASLVGYIVKGELNRIYIDGSVTAASYSFANVAGVVGYSYSTLQSDNEVLIRNVIFNGTIENDGYISAGILGYHKNDSVGSYAPGMIENAIFIGSITGAAKVVSGITAGDIPVYNVLVHGSLSTTNLEGDIYMIARDHTSFEYLSVSDAYVSENTTFSETPLDQLLSSITEITMVQLDAELFYKEVMNLSPNIYDFTNLDYVNNVFISLK